MEDLNIELWKLGIFAKTEHNEVAPAQHELAPIFHNNQYRYRPKPAHNGNHAAGCRQASSGLLAPRKALCRSTAPVRTQQLVLIHRQRWNFFAPGDTPYENAQFLLFLVAVIQAVDDYQGLLRASVATAGNDHRLGASEAPPAVISIFLGNEPTEILDSIENDTPYRGIEKQRMKLNVDVLPRFVKDNTDRNRTSPLAFTGNKFEFRMLGSSDSIACANIMLNTTLAESLRLFADELEAASDFNTALHKLIKKTITAHKRIIFNGNGYDDAWLKEATEKRDS